MGWYTNDGQKYESTVMPEKSVHLKAGWEITARGHLQIVDSENEYASRNSGGWVQYEMRDPLMIDLSDFIPENFDGTIRLNGSFMIRASFNWETPIHFGLFPTNMVTTSPLYEKEFAPNNVYEQVSYSTSIKITGNKIYCALKINDTSIARILNYQLDFECTYFSL